MHIADVVMDLRLGAHPRVRRHVFDDYPSLSLHDRGRDWVVYQQASATSTP